MKGKIGGWRILAYLEPNPVSGVLAEGGGKTGRVGARIVKRKDRAGKQRQLFASAITSFVAAILRNFFWLGNWLLWEYVAPWSNQECALKGSVSLLI